MLLAVLMLRLWGLGEAGKPAASCLQAEGALQKGDTPNAYRLFAECRSLPIGFQGGAEDAAWVELTMGQLTVTDLWRGTESLETARAHWNTALKLNPNYAEVMVELARLEFHWPRKKIHPHFIRYDIAVPLLERCLELAPTNKMAIDGYAFILLIQSQGLRQVDPAAARTSWEKLQSFAQGKGTHGKGNHGKKTTFGDSVAKWRVFTAQLNKRAKKQASEPEAAEANPPRCLGKADAWDMTHWPLAAAVQTIAASDGAKVRAALEKGMPTPVLVSGGGTRKLDSVEKLDSIFSHAADAVVPVVVPHRGGVALRLERTSQWATVESVKTSLHELERELGHRPSKVIVRGARTYMRFGDFLAHAALPAFGKKKPDGKEKPFRPSLYLLNGNLQVYLPELAQPMLDGAFADDGELLAEIVSEWHTGNSTGNREVNVWMGTDGTTSGLHKDMIDNWLYVAEGVKDVVLFPPHEGDSLLVNAHNLDITVGLGWGKRGRGPPRNLPPAESNGHEWVTGADNFVMVNLNKPSEEHKGMHPIHATVRPGEALFIPRNWYHNVLSRPEADRRTASCRVVAFNFWRNYAEEARKPVGEDDAQVDAANDTVAAKAEEDTSTSHRLTSEMYDDL